jgi:hypothetical protein
MRISAAFTLTFAIAGCDAPFAMFHAASARAPSDLGCPAASVSQHHHASRLATEPAFRGCGRAVVYHCMKTSGQEDTSCAPIWIGSDDRSAYVRE